MNPPNNPQSNRSSRIIRSRQGATSTAGWLSQSQSTQAQPPPTPPTSEPTTPELSEHVYLEVPESIEGSNPKASLFKCLRKAAMMSTLLADMLNQNEILSGRLESGCPVLPLSNPYCSPGAIENIINWCEYHCDDPIAEQAQNTLPGAAPTTSSTTYRSFDDLDEDRDQYESKYEIPCYWDRSWIQSIGGVSLGTDTRAKLYDLLIAAHYLGIDRLVELGAKYICKQICGKSCDEVRALLNIVNDLEPAEERAIHDNNAWVAMGNSSGASGGTPTGTATGNK